MKELHDPLNTPLPYQTLGYEINCQVMKAEIRGWGTFRGARWGMHSLGR